MKATKGFDCLRMKRDLQGRLHKKWKGLTVREIQADITKDLSSSQLSLAKWWRRTIILQAKTTAC